jgi:hypothetical protein
VSEKTILSAGCSTQRPRWCFNRNSVSTQETEDDEPVEEGARSFRENSSRGWVVAYGRVLETPYVAFCNYRTLEPSADLDTIALKPVLFRQAVRTSGLKNWDHIGAAPLSGEVAERVVRYSQDTLDFRKCVIYDSVGNERAATPEECVGIEQAAVWDAHPIEDRLLDTFMGRPNQLEIRSRVRLK